MASAASQSAECQSSPKTQKSNSRNVLASPLGEEGHEVAKGVQANWIHRGEKGREATCESSETPSSEVGVDGGKNDYDTRCERDRRKAAL